ncbi:MAG: leucyl aminopeptidase [Actinomycetota bacterium]|nr:leucyl aminopeptidase [Actinomycetota bacterium]
MKTDQEASVSLELTVAAPPADRIAAELLAVPIGAGRALGPGADAVDAALDGGLDAFMQEADFQGKSGETLAVPTRGRLRADAAMLVGVGKFDELTADGLRRAAAAVARKARKVASVATTLVDLSDAAGLERADAAQAVAEGFVLGSYQFVKYKSERDASKLAEVIVIGRSSARVNAALERGLSVADAVTWARDMVNEPAGAKSPATFAAAARKLLRGKGVTVKVMTEAEMKAEGLGGVLGVGQGSANPPRLVKATYSPPGAKGFVALVGKGVVFDSGGLSIKSSSGMETMKTDMSGGAAVLAAVSVLKDLGIKTKVAAYVPMVENMPSGTAIRPGDVLRIHNGKTVEVLNTDAEGRLILADGLSLAAEDKPDAVVDVATLTGACMVALGEKIAGLMGNRDSWNDQVQAAADAAGEPVWELPLPSEYRKLLDSEVADLRNISTGNYGGALTAALFLSEFVDGVPWAHLDIAGPARASSDDGYLVKGGTGFAVRTLVELVDRFKKPARSGSKD